MRIPSILLTSLLILPAAAEEEESTPLAETMSSLNDTMKLIKREDDPKKAATLSRQAQDSLISSFQHMPAMLTKMPEGPKKEQATADYRRMLSEALTILCKMEQAFLTGDAKAADELRLSAHDLKLEAHEKFMEQE